MLFRSEAGEVRRKTQAGLPHPPHFASLADGLPGQPEAVLDRSIRVVVYDGKGLRLEAGPIRVT